MATELGVGYLSIIPEMSGFEAKLRAETQLSLAAAGRSGGKQFGQGVAAGAEGAKSALRSVAAVAAGLGVAKVLSASIAEATEARKVGAQTAAVLASTAGAANVSAAAVGQLATQLSLKSGIDDETIQSGENLLLTFRQVRNEVGAGNDIFRQGTVAALDMSVAMGTDLRSSTILVGKALNDPIRGMTALNRVGVTFTAQQRAQVASLVASGNALDAQKVILAEFSKEFGGSAAAAATPADKLRVSVKNLEESIGTGLFPVLDKGAKGLSTLADGLNSLPTPVRSVVEVGVAGASAYALFGSRLTSVAGNVRTMVGGLGSLVTGTSAAAAADTELAAASTAAAAGLEAEAAAGAQAAAATAASGGGIASLAGRLGSVAAVVAPVAALGYGFGKLTDRVYGTVPAVNSLQAALTGLGKGGPVSGVLGQTFGGDLGGLVNDIKSTSVVNSGSGIRALNEIAHLSTFGLFHSNVDKFRGDVSNVDKALAGMVTSGDVDGAQRAFEQITKAAAAGGVPIETVTGLFGRYRSAVRDAAAATPPMTDNIAAMGVKADPAAKKVAALTDAAAGVVARYSQVGVATDAVSAAKNDLASSLADARANGYTKDFLDPANTDATSIQLRGKLRAIESASNDLAAAWVRTGVKGQDLNDKEVALKDGLADFGTQIGLTVPQNATLTGSIDLIAAAYDRMTLAAYVAADAAYNVAHPDAIPRSLPATPVPVGPGAPLPTPSAGKPRVAKPPSLTPRAPLPPAPSPPAALHPPGATHSSFVINEAANARATAAEVDALQRWAGTGRDR